MGEDGGTGPASPGGARRAAVLGLPVGHSLSPALHLASLEAGCTVVSGLSVLLHQAVGQVRLMTGLAAAVDAMRAALDAATARRAVEELPS